MITFKQYISEKYHVDIGIVKNGAVIAQPWEDEESDHLGIYGMDAEYNSRFRAYPQGNKKIDIIWTQIPDDEDKWAVDEYYTRYGYKKVKHEIPGRKW